MRRYGFLILVCMLLPGAHTAGQVASPSVTVTYLYDNTTVSSGAKPDWGFSCLVQRDGKNVLFDTGANPDILRTNMTALHIDASRIDAVVFSHEHADHTAGVAGLGERSGLPAFFPAAFGEATRAAFARQKLVLMPVSKATTVIPGFATSNEMGTQIREELLVVEAPGGLLVVAGCAHPGIVPMLREISSSRKLPIHMVLGGFHLLQTPADVVKRIISDFKSMNIEYVGPTHCTGDEAIGLFRAAYGAHFITGGVGTVVRIPVEASR